MPLRHLIRVLRGGSGLCVLAAALAVGYSALFYERGPDAWGVSLFVLGLGGAITAILPLERGQVTAAEKVAFYASLLLCAYGALQIIPLPVSLLRTLDPTRAEVASALRIVAPGLRFSSLTVDQGKTCLRLSWIVGQVLLFLLIREATRRADGSWFVAAPLLVLGGAEAAVAMLQRAAGAGAVVGTSDNKDHLAGFLEMTLPFAILCGISFLRPGRSLRVRDAVRASFFLALAAAILVAIIFTLSKMGFASMVGSLLLVGIIAIFAKLTGRTRWAGLVGLTAALLAFAVFLPTNQLVGAFAGVGSDPTAEGRIPIWKDALHLIAAYPLFGSGLGTFYPAFSRYQTYGVSLAWLSSHSDYLDFASELGASGFLILAVFVCAALVCAAKAAVSGRTGKVRLLGLACVGGLAAMLIHGLADFNMHVPVNAMLFAWIAGIAVALPLCHAETRGSAASVHGVGGS